MRGRTILKKAAGTVLAALILAVNFSPRVQSLRELPGTLTMDEGQRRALDFLFPLKADVRGDAADVLMGGDETLSDVGAEATIRSNRAGVSEITFSLLGLKLKQVQVRVEPQKVLIPGGQTIGIAMMTRGVYVAGTEAITTPGGREINPAREAGIFPGDSILSVDGVQLLTFEQLRRVVLECDGQELAVRVLRDNREHSATIQPRQDESGVYRLGLWARDSTAGIGTLTYTDPQEHTFGALGHAITDGDTGGLLNVRDGAVYPSNVVGVEVGRNGTPGELRGVFSTEGQMLCDIRANTEYGIYGEVYEPFRNPLYPEGLPIATQDMVVEGGAQILCTLDDSGVKAYDCRVIKITRQAAPSTRSLVVEVTDPELLRRTGGIVQGMSGSPIIQNGRIIGAVTHVFVNDPTRGFGLYIEWMLAAQEEEVAA